MGASTLLYNARAEVHYDPEAATYFTVDADTGDPLLVSGDVGGAMVDVGSG